MHKVSKLALIIFFLLGMFFIYSPKVNACTPACVDPEVCVGVPPTDQCQARGCSPNVHCNPDQVCIDDNCFPKGGGGAGGGTVCDGCKGVGDYSAHKEPPIVAFTVQKKTDTSAFITWVLDATAFACGRSDIGIFIGRDKRLVNNECLVAGDQADMGKNWPTPGCNAIYYLNDGTLSGTIDTSVTPTVKGNIFSFSPGVVYYVKVESRYFYTDQNNNDAGSWCGVAATRPYLPVCSLTPATATMSVGDVKTFVTSIDTSTAGTTYNPSPYVNASKNDANNNIVLLGYNFGSGTDQVTINLNPQITSIVCYRSDQDREVGSCGDTHDYVDIYGKSFGPGPDKVYLNGKLKAGDYYPTRLTGMIRYPFSGNPFGANVWQVAAPYAPIVGNYPVTVNGPGINGDQITLTGYKYGWGFSSINVAYTGASVPPPSYKVDKVNYTSGDTATLGITSVNPDTVPDPFSVDTLAKQITGATPVPLISDVYAGGIAAPKACTATSNITITGATPAPPVGSFDPWWQVKDGDVNAKTTLGSKIPDTKKFDDVGLGNFPGIPVYGQGLTDITSANVSTKSWIAKYLLTPRPLNYLSVTSQLPPEITSTINNIGPGDILADVLTSPDAVPDARGYYWFKYDASGTGIDLNLDDALNLGDRKVVLLVNGANFNINKSINLNKGTGFFMVLVGGTVDKGNIAVNPNVGGAGISLEGIYVADNAFSTGTNTPAADSALHLRGSVVAYGGISVPRNLTGAANANPAELFEYAPDQIALFPASTIGLRKINWKEVAP